jgi:hypothetical protein
MWATKPLKLDQDASKIYAIILPSWGPQELTMETTDSPDKQIVRANGIPRAKRLYELAQGTSPASFEAVLRTK